MKHKVESEIINAPKDSGIDMKQIFSFSSVRPAETALFGAIQIIIWG